MAIRKKAAKTNVKAKTKAVAKKAAPAKKKVADAAPKALGKVGQPFTKSELILTLAERTDLTKKQVTAVFAELANVVEAHIKKTGPGKFTLPGLLKVTIKKVAAKKARKGINPFTKEEMIFKAKPASRKVKVTPLKALKAMSEN
jgi:nucleoid DNA-binding protein